MGQNEKIIFPSVLPQVVRNEGNVFEGSLEHYFRVIFFHARNLLLGYHNFRHMLHVFWTCYEACIYYSVYAPGSLTPREMRNLLIAALFHDFDHSGMMGDDDLNIERATRGLRKYVAEEDKIFLEDIESILKPTQFPYIIPSEKIRLSAQILRDADMSQALNPAWIQQVILGLSTEWNKKPVEVLAMQPAFLRSIKFQSEWAKKRFSPEMIEEKAQEAEHLLEILVPQEKMTV
jgi:hypothetical protein